MVALTSTMLAQEKEPGTLTLGNVKAQPVWVCFRLINGTKPPFNPLTGRGAKQNDPTTWASYEEALKAFHNPANHYDGVGFQLCPDFLPITGVDLDHCIDPETGEIDAWAQEIIELLASYTELSPSKTGVHILLVGNAQGVTQHKISVRKITENCHPKAKIEVYDQARYFTLTENRLPDLPAEIMPRQEQLQAVYEKVTRGRPAPVNSISQTERRPSFGPLDLTDNELLDKAMQAQNGTEFRRLWNGEIGANADKSTADFLLCLDLAFWTGKDAARIDRLFRRSNLYREKWDRKTGNSTYGELTISRAINECGHEYTGTNGAARRAEEELERIFASRQDYRNIDEWEKKPYHLEPKEIPAKRVLECLDLNEWGDALLFAEAFEGAVLYDATEKAWYLWTGQYWRKDHINQVKQLVSGHVGAIYIKTSAHLNTKVAEIIEQIEAVGLVSEEADRLKGKRKDIELQMKALNERAKVLRSAKRCLAVLNTFATSDDRITITSEAWDAHPWLLATQNGVIDLKTGKRRDGRPEDYIRTVVPTTWEGLTATCPRFLQFLNEIFQDRLPGERAELISFLRRLLGYAITGLTAEHIFPILCGEEGRNGKDTLLAILKFVLGPIASAISNDVLVASDKGRAGGSASPHLVDLQGKRLVWGSETKQGAVFNVAQVKLLTGGGEISARPLYGHQYTFKPTHTLLLITNYKPHADARDKAFWERACLIEFNTRFVDDPTPGAKNERKKDIRLTETLQAEASGILAWLVQGCLEWQQEGGLKRPASVLIATNQYRESEDQLQLFLNECCYVEDSTARIKASELYETYRTWCKDGGLGSMNSTLFGTELSKKYAKKRVAEGVCYHGIRLREADDPIQEVSPKPYIDAGTALEADAGTEEGRGYVGYVGINHKVPPSPFSNGSHEGLSGQTLHTLHKHNNDSAVNEPGELDEEAMYSSASDPVRDDTLLNQVAEQVANQSTCFWRVPQSGFSNGYVSPDEYVNRLRQCLASGESKRIQAAREEIEWRLR